MQKTYNFSSIGGQVSKDASDVKLQVGNGVALRNVSLEEMKNYMPDKDFFAKSINGVGLEYFISNKPSKTFTANTHSVETLFHIYEDRIITVIPSIGKFFIDTIPEDILVDVNSVDTAIITGDSKSQFLRFNSITGIYKCTILPAYPSNINNGEPYFSKIEIPESLTTANIEIKKTTGNIYIFRKIKNPTNKFTLLTPQTVDEELSGIYIEAIGTGIKAGDTVSFTVNTKQYASGYFHAYPSGVFDMLFTAKALPITIQGVSFERYGVKKIYPTSELPQHLTQKQDLYLVSNAWSGKRYPLKHELVNLTEDTQPVVLIKLDIDINEAVFDSWFARDPFSHPEIEASEKFDDWTGRDFNYIQQLAKECVRFEYAFYPETFGKGVSVYCDISCDSFLDNQINILSSGDNNELPTAPTMAVVDKRLVIGYKNRVKFSAVNDLDNFNPTPNDVPTESDSFVRTLDDINEILFLAKWGTVEKGQGIVVGTPETLIYLSSVATMFNASRIDSEAIPCSRIKPVDIRVGGIVAKFIVLNGRKEIKASIFTKDQTQTISLTSIIDFFRTDPIKKIQAMAYGDDQLLFALTDKGKLYGALTGNQMLAWFEISLKYPVRDITTSDNGGIKKLFIVSLMGAGSNYDAVGSIDFTEGVSKVKAEYYTNLYMEKDYVFSEEYPAITGNTDYKTAKELTEEQKQKITKPMNGSLTLHNMQIINSRENTSNKKRQIKNVILNVKETNLLQVNYITQQNGRNEIKTTAYTLSRVDDNLNTDLVNEQIKIHKPSMVGQLSAKINIQTLDNSSIPTIIKSVQFDTEYADN